LEFAAAQLLRRESTIILPDEGDDCLREKGNRDRKKAPQAADANCLAEWWKFHTHVQVANAEMGVGINKKTDNKFILGQKV
jgi:hypothetical protein